MTYLLVDTFSLTLLSNICNFYSFPKTEYTISLQRLIMLSAKYMEEMIISYSNLFLTSKNYLNLSSQNTQVQ